MAGKITLKDIRGLGENEDVWDGETKGFGARRQRSTAVAYVLMYRTTEGRQRRYTIGRHGSPWTPDTARDEARRLLGVVSQGGDPGQDKLEKRKASTVAELCDNYLEDAEAGRLLTRRRAAKKASTIYTDKGRVERHIKPLLGRLGVAAVTREDIERFMHAVAEGKTAVREKSDKKHGLTMVRGGRGTASRTVGLLGAIFTYAVRKRLRPDNPVQGVMRFADGRRERRVSDEEYALLGAALRWADGEVWPAGVALFRFLAVTGWRSGEAIALTWGEVDVDRRTATLADSKTGKSVRPLSASACGILSALPRSGDLVFKAGRGSGRMTGFPIVFARIRDHAGLTGDITPHVLRHSFASVAGDLGYSESTIGALIGHKGASITSRYIHSADAVLLAAADAVAGRIAVLMEGG